MPLKIRTAGCCECLEDGCALECRSIAGFGMLCGFPEFVPSDPPKRYRQRTIIGQALTCIFPTSTCGATCPVSGPASYQFSGEGQTYSGSPWFSYGGTFVPASYNAATDRWTYQCVMQQAKMRDIVNGQTVWYDVPSRPSITGTAYRTNTGGNNWTIQAPTCLDTDAGVEIFSGGTWARASDSVQRLVTPPADVSFSGTRDVWDVTDTYNLTGNVCAPTRDAGNSQRISLPAGQCSKYGTGTVGSLPSIDPAEAYAGFLSASDTATVREWASTGCHAVTGGSQQVDVADELVETLSDEDTLDEAIARATEGQEWSGGECHLHTAFVTEPAGDPLSFGFRRAQVRALCGSVDPLIVGHDYELTITFSQRVLGSGGLFLPSSQVVISFTADTAPTDTTEWVDVPNEAGMETMPTRCQLVDVTL